MARHPCTRTPRSDTRSAKGRGRRLRPFVVPGCAPHVKRLASALRSSYVPSVRETVTTGDAGRIVVRTIDDRGADRPDTPVFVLVHGVGMSHRYLRRLHSELARSSRVVSIDLPGFGGTPRPKKDVDVAEMGLMLAETVDPLGSDRLVLIGHSMGVQWVIEAAAHLGDAVRSVVLIGPVVDDAHRSMAAQARALAIDTMGESSLINAIVVTDYLRCGIRWYLRQVRHMVAYPTLDRIRMLAVPVLVIRGSRDPVAGRRWCRRLVSAASNARLVEVPGQHHVVQHSAPRAVAGAIREHLDRTVSGLREDARRGSGC